MAGGTPIFALDMYEHSYHIDYGAKAASYAGAPALWIVAHYITREC
jgi:superoxide dismutase